jgi:hypothetical protein
MREVREVAAPSYEQLRTNPRVLGERRPAVDDERRKTSASSLDRERETNRSRTNDR